MVPLLAYIMLQTNIASLYTCVQLAQDFLPERHTYSQVGYFLATIQTCFTFLECLEKDDVC
jgi:hypothetical protein